MLDPFLPDGSENRLRMVIGEEILEILLDHLTYPGGPRVRDRLSHGEACWERFPWQLTRNLATICVALSAMFVKDGKHIHNKCVTILHEDIKSYSVQFHRISLLKKEISTFFKKASETDSMILLQPDLSERKPNDPFQSTDEVSSLEAKLRDIVAVFDGHWAYFLPIKFSGFQYCDLHHLKSTVDEILQQKIHTLYRNSKMQQFATNRQQQMTLKQLRSRQRENFKKFLASVPSLVVGPCTCVYMCCCQLYQLDEIKAREGPQSNNKLIKFWKSVLKLCENLRTFTHHDKNKWTEGEEHLKLKMFNTHISEKETPIHLMLSFPKIPKPQLHRTTKYYTCNEDGVLISSNAEDEPSLYFPACVTSLAPILTSVENHVEDIGPQNFLDTYLPYDEVTALLVSSAVLERALGDMLDTFLLNGTENRHRMVMGEDILEILLDHLTYPAGPRVRDRFSHGEPCWEKFPWQLKRNLATSNKAVTALHGDIKSYRVQFHRISLLKKENRKLRLNTVICYLPVEGSWLYCDLHNLKSTVDEILQEKIHTLYRNSKIQQFATNRQQQLTLKQLRSRQRDNFKKFLASVPSLLLGPCTCVYLCCWQLYHLDGIKTREGPQSNSKLIKFWKSVMQICENLRTFTRHDKNKWTEGAELVYQLDSSQIFDLLGRGLSATDSARKQCKSNSDAFINGSNRMKVDMDAV
ncbi:EMARD-like protein [Mya arenaria]|uniref:EMARD-like protein n=1 Tax=Mya arenaria TaxID=6604 RepID=A0ABY7FI72_MYAAR|nr:EMARD-like protein [Mya arenaria]